MHAVARSIIAETVIGRVSGDLENSVRRMLPAAEAEPARDAALPEDFDARADVVTAVNEGYVQSIDYESLLELATRHRVLIRFDYRAGEFMCRGGWLAFVYPGDDLNGEIEKGVRENVLIGDRRTPEQDLEFSIRHLVDIALRALSPAINDPNTAMAVVDRLRGALAQAMEKKLPTTIRHDSRGILRIVGDDTGFDGIFDAAFHQIRQAAATHPAVVIHMLGAVYRLAEHVRTADQCHALLRHAELFAAAGLSQAEEPRDRADIDGAFAEAKRKLQRTRSIRRDAAGSGRQDRDGTVVMWRGLPSPP
ncbi:DUF2254 domain-containing protein (plasmid) [Skermanella rosea]|uniref:DUF2254 domain-containing protein n=1 Tax=Skermanella rosea TaxID=1817965 RepID=UPI001E5491FE|nr:DUF2254 family protein [Skermanella rosea]UEM07250.1 DUF2254 domain-containing protein [Skermanella rosea]